MTKGQGAIVGFIGLFFTLVVAITLLSALGDFNHQMQCSSEISQINDLNGRITATGVERDAANAQLQVCQNSYSELLEYNITKQDFQEIKSEINQTNVYVSNTYSRLENIENKINNFNRTTINIINLSFALNIALAIEVLSFAFLKGEFLQWVWNFAQRKRRKKKEDSPL